jgi:hypothetical protein
MSELQNAMPWHAISFLFFELPYWICLRWYIFNGGLSLLGSFLVVSSDFLVVLILVLTPLTHCCFLTHTCKPMSFHPVQNHMSVAIYIITDDQAIPFDVLGPSCWLACSNESKPKCVLPNC